MKQAVANLELPIITAPDHPAPRQSTEETLRWRIAKREGTKPAARAFPQGERFEWIESPSPNQSDH